MFADAYEIARQFTHPTIISVRHYDGTVVCNLGAFVVLNDEGWAITAAHLWEVHFAKKHHEVEIQAFQEAQKTIRDEKINQKQKQRKLKKLKANPKWITNISFWWGKNNVNIEDIKPLPNADIVVGRLEPFEPKMTNYSFPTIKNPAKELKCGTSLCRLGYPFHLIDASFDESTNRFELAPGALPVPLFPIEGILTRFLRAGKSEDGKFDIKLIETSSPGLRGQSGGPIFDTKGTVWGIQSRTVHFPLGFSPKILKNKKEVEEHQFLSVGVGVHPDTLIQFLKEYGIKYTLSDY